jgi:hypothetical protein
MAAIRAELPVKPLPPVAAAAAPPCDVAFAPERVVVLTKYSYRRVNKPEPKKGNLRPVVSEGRRPAAESVADLMRMVRSAIWGGEANTVPAGRGGENLDG